MAILKVTKSILLFFILLLPTFYLDAVEIASPLINRPTNIDQQKVQSKIVEYYGKEEENSADPYYWYEFSQQYILLDNLPRAEKQLKKALLLEPDFFEAKVQLGYLYLFLGEEKRALELFSQLQEKESCNRFVLEGLYRVAQQLKNKKEESATLLDIYYKLLNCDSSNCDYQFFLGHTLYRMGKKKESKGYFLRCLELCPEYDDALFFLRKIEESDEENGGELRQIPPPIVEKAKSVDVAAVESEILELYGEYGNDSVDPIYWYKLARLYIQFNQLSKAKKQLEYAIELSPLFQEATIQLGYLYLFQKDELSAYKVFNDYTKEHPCNQLVNIGLYKIAKKFKKGKNNKREMEKIFRYLVDCDPYNCDYLFILGQTLFQMGKKEEAALYLQKSLDACPKYSDAANLLKQIDNKNRALPRRDSSVPRPITKRPSCLEREEAEPILNQLQPTDDKGSLDPHYWYNLSHLMIKLNKLDRAESSLHRALKLSPSFVEASIQLGYVTMWKGRYLSAYEIFIKELDRTPCDPLLLNGLDEIARHWLVEESHLQEVYTIYDRLVDCDPMNCDYLFFKGNILYKLDRVSEAVEYYSLCLEQCPDYFDAAHLLAKNYVKERNYSKARWLMEKFPCKVEALEVLASIAYVMKDWKGVEVYNRSIVEQEPFADDARHNLAYSLYRQKAFKAAKKQLITLLNFSPCDNNLVQEYLYEVKPFTNFSLEPKFNLVRSKEQDPYLEEITVRTLYLNTALTLHLPINDRIRLDGTLVYNRQREKDVYPPTIGNNYNVYMGGAELEGDLIFSSCWKMKLLAREIYSWSEGDEFFPYSDRYSFEPGSYSIYDSDDSLFVLGGHYESFVVKNFNTHRSELLRYCYTQVKYGRKLRYCEKDSHISTWFSESFYRDNIRNRRDLLGIYAETNLPFLPKELSLTWLAEWSRFRELSRSYYTYDRQWLNELGIVYRRDFCSCYYIELMYREKWRSSRDVFLPVGDTVFVSPKLFIRGYRPSINLGYRYRDKMVAEVGGHYYYDTFPYWDYNLHGRVVWYF